MSVSLPHLSIFFKSIYVMTRRRPYGAWKTEFRFLFAVHKRFLRYAIMVVSRSAHFHSSQSFQLCHRPTYASKRTTLALARPTSVTGKVHQRSIDVFQWTFQWIGGIFDFVTVYEQNYEKFR